MKKIFIVIIASMLCVPMFAQRDTQSQRGGGRSTSTAPLAQKKHAFYLGIKGGLDITSMTQPNECDLYDGAGVGGSIGVVGKVRFKRASQTSFAGTGLWGAGLELKYKNNSVKTIGTNELGREKSNLSVGYIEIPIYAQLFPFFKTNKMNTFYIEAGPDFAASIGRSPKTLTVDNMIGDFGSVTYNIDNDGSKLKGMDFRIMFGLGYDLPIKNSKHETSHLIGLNARYYVGTSKLAGNFPCKMNTFELSLSWMFNIGKL